MHNASQPLTEEPTSSSSGLPYLLGQRFIQSIVPPHPTVTLSPSCYVSAPKVHGSWNTVSHLHSGPSNCSSHFEPTDTPLDKRNNRSCDKQIKALNPDMKGTIFPRRDVTGCNRAISIRVCQERLIFTTLEGTPGISSTISLLYC